MTEFSLLRLRDAVESDAAIRRVQKLLPIDGPGGKVFPPTYPGNGRNASAQHIWETRRIEGRDVPCVLLDSVQSQANRLEEALLGALRRRAFGDPHVGLPHVVVDFSDRVDLSDIGEITSLDAPHRLFDAIIRDSELDGRPFVDTPQYKELILAKPTKALAIFKLSPTSLVFGAWNSTGQGGGLGARFARTLVSEIVGVAAAPLERAAVRVDPLGIRSSAGVSGGPLDWKNSVERKGEKAKRPSEVGHSNIISAVTPAGASIDYALHSVVISCAGARRSRFPEIRDEGAGRAALAAIALVAVTEQDRAGYALRSRCDLVPDARAPFEIVRSDGQAEQFSIDAAAASKLLAEAVEAAKKAGFPWNPEPLRLRPQTKLLDLVLASREKALQGETEETAATP